MTTPQQMEVAEIGITGFWRSISGQRRRSLTPRTAPIKASGRTFTAPVGQAPPNRKNNYRAISDDRAQKGQASNRAHAAAESMADSFAAGLSGNYAYRALKNEFDGYCEEAEIATVTDKRFALWLQARGGVKYRVRVQGERITMYEFKRRLAKAA